MKIDIDIRTRRKLVKLILEEGVQSAKTIAERLKVSEGTARSDLRAVGKVVKEGYFGAVYSL